MTLSEAKTCCEREGGTGLTDDEKTALISGLDGRIHGSVISHYEGADGFAGYTTETDGETVLLVPAPYDEIYPVYLMSVGALLAGANERYSVYSTLYNTLFTDFACRFGNTHTAESVKIRGI